MPEDFAAAMYPREGRNDPRPAGCSLAHGQKCTLQFKGRFALVNYDQAIIWVGAYEDGQPSNRFLTMVVTKQTPKKDWFANLNYTPSPGAKKVQFRVQLRDVQGNIIFDMTKNDPEFPIR